MSGSRTTPDCLFCKIVAGDVPATVVHETDATLAFRDLEPQAPTHVLVIPRRHVPDVAALAREAPEEVAQVVDAVAAVARVGGCGGQRLPHRLQHRQRRPADRVPRPRARARGPGNDVAARLSGTVDWTHHD